MEASALLKAAKKLQDARDKHVRLQGEAERAHAHAFTLDVAAHRAGEARSEAHEELMKLIDGNAPVGEQKAEVVAVNCPDCGLYHANVSNVEQVQCSGEDGGCWRFRPKEGGAA